MKLHEKRIKELRAKFEKGQIQTKSVKKKTK